MYIPTTKILLIFAYVPTSSNSQSHGSCLENLRSELDEIKAVNPPDARLVIMGDMNCRIGTIQEKGVDTLNLPPRSSQDLCHDHSGIKMMELIDLHNLYVVNGRTAPDLAGAYTHYSTNGNSVIDVALADPTLFNLICSFEVSKRNDMSDHAMIKLDLTIRTAPPPTRLCLNPVVFKKHINSNPPPLTGTVNELAGKLDTLSRSCMKKRRPRAAATGNDNTGPAYPDGVFGKLSVSIEGQKLFAKLNKRPSLVFTLKNKETTPTPPCAEDLAKFWAPLFKGQINSTSPLTSWASPPSLNGLQARKPEEFYSWSTLAPSVCQLPLDPPSYYRQWLKWSEDPPILKSDVNQLMFWRNYRSPPLLRSSHWDTASQWLRGNEDVPTKLVPAPSNSGILLQPAAESEIAEALAGCNLKSSAGSDGISYEDIKNNHHFLIPYLSRLFTKILFEGVYPDCWRISLLIPIYKRGDPSYVANYRPICLQSCTAKLFSKMLELRLRNWLRKYSPLRNEQFGFTPGTGTIDAATVLYASVAWLVEKGHNVYATFIDFSSAFDTIDHELLLNKLRHRSIPEPFIALLHSMYSSNTTSVISGEHSSLPFPIATGVKQGDPLSPLLFSIFIDDLPDSLDNCGSRPLQLGNCFIRSILYADDVVILAESETDMNRYLSTVEIYAKENNLKINASKSQAMVFQKRSPVSTPSKPNFFINGDAIEIVNSFKYLGLWFDNNLLFGKAVKEAKAKLSRLSALVPSMFTDIALYPTCAIRSIYNAVILGGYLYGAEIWGLFAGSSELSDHLRFLKITLKLPWSTSSALLEREINLLPPTTAHTGTALRHFFKMRSSPSETLLGQAFTALSWLPPCPRNLIHRAKTLLSDMHANPLVDQGLPAHACTSLVKLQLVVDRAELVNNRIAKQYANHPLVSTHRPMDAYALYSELMPLELAHTLLLVRCNALFKPTQYRTPGRCLFCEQRLGEPCDGWTLVTHVILACTNTSINMWPVRYLDTIRLQKLFNLEEDSNSPDQKHTLFFILEQLLIIKHSICTPLSASQSSNNVST